MVRQFRRLLAPAALGSLAVALLTAQTQASASYAAGTVTISPTSVGAASTGNNFSLKYHSPPSQAVSGSVSFIVPAKWSKPQTSTSTAAGFVSVHRGSCSKAKLGPVVTNADRSSTLTASVTCAAGKSFTLTYATVTAPRKAGSYQFTTKAKLSPSTVFLSFATEPKVEVAPGPAVALAFGTQPTTTVAGAHITPAPTVRVVDAYGNLTGSTASVTMSIGTNPAGGTLSGTTTVAASAGTAPFPDLSVDNAGSVYTLLANSAGFPGTTSFGFNVTPAALDHLVISPDPGWLTAGRSKTYTAEGFDRFNNSRGDATAATTFSIAPDGSCSQNACTASVAGDHTVTGSDATKTDTATLHVIPGPAAALALGTQPSTTGAGVHIIPAPTVRIVDAYGNLTGSTANVTMAIGTNPAGGTLSGTVMVAASGGTATFADLSIDRVGSGYTLAASSTGLLGAKSSGFNVTAHTETWSTTASMATSRVSHTATLLPNGKVLVAGGLSSSYVTASAELYDPANGTWSATGSMATSRDRHTATLLPNGKVLVAGGVDNSNGIVASAELYDPANGTWSTRGSMATARAEHTATLLSNGKVLVAGGYNHLSGALASAELYDPVSGTWSTTASLATSQQLHTATLLSNGKVLVAGQSDAELYDPASETWSTTGSMATGRFAHTATLLSNGKVLVAGGDGYQGSDRIALASAELYDPMSGAWSNTASMATARWAHISTLLSNGKVLVAGGEGNDSGSIPLASAELYDPAN